MVATPSAMMPLGTAAPDFSLPASDGSLHGTVDAAGAPGLLVVFLCNHCPYVKHVADALGRLASGWMGDGLPVIGADLDAAVHAVLAGEAPSGDQRPSVGCSIKWKPGMEPGSAGR